MDIETAAGIVAVIERNVRHYDDEAAYLRELNGRLPHFATDIVVVEAKAKALRELLECIEQERTDRRPTEERNPI